MLDMPLMQYIRVAADKAGLLRYKVDFQAMDGADPDLDADIDDYI